MRRWSFALTVTCAVACGSFDAAPATGTDGGAIPGTDAGVTSGPGGLYRCPHADVPAGDLPLGKQSVIYKPAITLGEKSAPFGIATDSTSIYWIEQHGADADSSKIYNGDATGRIRRQTKGQLDSSVVLADGQPRARQMAVQGDWVYWSVSSDGSKSAVRRVRRDCTGGCEPEEVFVNDGANQDIRFLLAAGEKSLFAQYANGFTIEIDVAKSTQAGTPRGTVGEFASITVAADAALVTTKAASGVQRLAFGGTSPASAFAPLVSGVRWLAADCADVLAITEGGNVWRSPIVDPNFTLAATTLGALDIIYGVARDRQHLYLAVANIGGVYAYDANTLKQQKLFDGNVWYVTADDDAIYWAEHHPESLSAGWLYRQPR